MAISLISSEKESKGQKIKINGQGKISKGSTLIKRGFAHMQKHGVIMDVTNVEQVGIAEDAGAVAVMVLDKLPYDVEKPVVLQELLASKSIIDIMNAVSIPIMAKCRIGHVTEARYESLPELTWSTRARC